MGVEYGWGTLRTALAGGAGRWQFLVAKGLSVIVLTGIGLLIASLTVVVSQPDRRLPSCRTTLGVLPGPANGPRLL